MLAAGLVLGASIPCDARPETSGPSAGEPSPCSAARCSTGSPRATRVGSRRALPTPSTNLPPRTERGADEHDCAPQGCWAWVRVERSPSGPRGGSAAEHRGPGDHRGGPFAGRGGHPVGPRRARDHRGIGWEVRHTATATPRRTSSSTGESGEGPAPDPAGSCAGADACGLECRSRDGGGSLSRWAGFSTKVAPGPGRRRMAPGHSSSTPGFLRESLRSRSGSARSSSRGRRRGPRWATASRPMPPAPHGIASVCDVPQNLATCKVRPERFPRLSEPDVYSLWTGSDGGFRYGGPLTPRPPPSSASGGTPPATGR